jgi:hypothetical protein
MKTQLLVFGFLLGAFQSFGASTTAARSAATVRLARPLVLSTNLVLATNALRRNAAVLTLDPNVIRTDRLTAVTRDARSGRTTTNQVNRTGEGFEVALAANQRVVLFTETNALRGQLDRQKTTFPGTLMVRSGSAAPRSGTLFLQPRQSPLPWDSRGRVYQTDLVVGLDMADGQEAVSLNPSVTVQFFAQDAQLEPDSVEIKHSGSGGYQEVRLSCVRSSATPRVTARCDLGELSQAIPVEPLRFMGVVESVLPLRFLIVSLIGGAIGGLLRRNARRTSAQRSTWAGAALQGSLIGLIIVSALTAGLSLAVGLVDIVGVEVGAFAVAGLAGFGGVVLLERFMRKAFGVRTETVETGSDGSPKT